MSKLPSRKLEGETAVVLGASFLVAVLLVLTAINAGPLWRDEVNTANLAQMPSLAELWHNLPYESFPPLWPLLLRACGQLGLAGTDESYRLLGLYVGLSFLGSLWLCARWIGCRAPTLSIGLLGCLPAFIFTVGANRAYGLASCLLMLSFGTLWRLLESPSRMRLLVAGFFCLLFAQCVYYDVFFLGPMVAGSMLVTLRRRHWKLAAALAGIGIACAGSLFIYLPIIRVGSAVGGRMMQAPNFDFALLWIRLSESVTARSSAELGFPGPEIWVWIALLTGGLTVAVIAQRTKVTSPSGPTELEELARRRHRADLALYCGTSMLLGVLGLMVFLYHLRYFTEKWYYVEMLCLCSICLDGLLGANRSASQRWGLLRVGFMAVTMTWGAWAAWDEAHTRRSNMDLIAQVLQKNAAPDDLIVVQTAFEGITFNRNYHGSTRWLTVPPIDSHLVHRNDLMRERMGQPEAMAPVLSAMTNALQAGHNVWLLGNMTAERPIPPGSDQPAEWLGTYQNYWNAQVSAGLLDNALREQVLEVSPGQRVFCFENLPIIRFGGFKTVKKIP